MLKITIVQFARIWNFDPMVPIRIIQKNQNNFCRTILCNIHGISIDIKFNEYKSGLFVERL